MISYPEHLKTLQIFFHRFQPWRLRETIIISWCPATNREVQTGFSLADIRFQEGEKKREEKDRVRKEIGAFFGPRKKDRKILSSSHLF